MSNKLISPNTKGQGISDGWLQSLWLVRGRWRKRRKHAQPWIAKATESREDYEIHTDYHLARWAVGVEVTEPNESVMSKINKLLTLAANEGATEHERKRAEETAERLMAQHMIEEHELRKAAERSGKTTITPDRSRLVRELRRVSERSYC